MLIRVDLNWTIEVVVGFFVSSVIITVAILSYLKLKHIKVKSLFYIRLSFLLSGLYFLLEAIADLFLNIFLARLYHFIYPLIVISFLIGVTYSKKESVYSISLILIFILLPILYITTFLPDVLEIIHVSEFDYLKIIEKGMLDLLIILFYILTGVLSYYWGFLIWRNTPFLYKKEAFLLVLPLMIIFPFSIVSYLFTLWHTTFIILSDITLALGWYVIIYAITKEPKLLYILPFTVYRIIVKDRDGNPLFDHDWSESNINENVFTGFINAVQLLSEEVMHIGGLLDVNLQEGILIVYNSKYITVGLVSSKSSKLLRDCVRNFTHDFEEQFEYLLKTSCKDMKKYEPAYFLIDRHFSNFPYRIISDKHHPLLMSAKYSKIPLQIDNKYHEIFKDDEEVEKIKAELIRFPISSHDDFIELYEELKDEKEVDFDKDDEEQSED